MKKSRMRFMEIAIIFVPVFVVMMLAGADCYAYSKYVGRYEACMNQISAGVLEELYEIDYEKTTKEYMCSEAAGDWNTCSLWIGSAASATVPTITAYKDSATIEVMYWGTCTDYSNPTARVWVDGDNNAIDDAKTVTRLGYPAFGSAKTTLDIGKFIDGAESEEVNECETVYTRTITVGRTHSGRDSSSQVRQTLKVRLIGGEGCGEEGSCDDWKPESYVTSDEWEGTTSIDIKIRNTEGRFGGVGLGAWNDNDIWAMPTDTIEWTTCYYPGVQTTSDTDVGSLNSDDYGYEIMPWELPTDSCLANLVPVTYEKLYVKVNKVGEWQNQFEMYGDAGYYKGSWERGDTTIRSKTLSKTTAEGDAGEIFTEGAKTGTPVYAEINRHKPSEDWEGCYCKGDATEWNYAYDAAGNIIKDANGNNTYNYDSPTKWVYDELCSCCTESEADTTSGNEYSSAPSNPNYTGHTNTYDSKLNDATVKFGPKDEELSVWLQYNFITSTDVSVESDLVYSGERSAIKIGEVTATVHTRYNNVTIADYATEVPDATISLYAYVSSSSGGVSGGANVSADVCEALKSNGVAKQCVSLKSISKTLNASGSLTGGTEKIEALSNKTYNAFDASAGDYMCVVSSVTPYTVAGDTDMSGGDGTAVLSSPDCAIIAKKPSFQVWGGSLYSVGDINTPYNSKVNIYKNYKSDIQSKMAKTGGTRTAFSSWVEQSLIIKDGRTSNLASGAAAGINNTTVGVGTSAKFCPDRATLSFANYSTSLNGPCGSSMYVGESGMDNGIKDRAELIEYWVGGNKAMAEITTTSKTAYDLSNPNQRDSSTKESKWSAMESATGATIRYAHVGGDISIKGKIPLETTYLLMADGTVTITGDIEYTDEKISFSQIPKLIIYAKNVNISCNATEVDAIIITGKGGSGNVDTCYNGGDVNDSARSKQLKIFGMVITDSIDLKRTYGAAANEGNRKDAVGTPSDGAAAEIFDFDSSILMWSEFMAGSNESDTLRTVYQHELAPRY